MEQYTNELINESSLYLQQHAHNPVNWVAWSDEAFETAKRENKLVLISIGYSSCHWCHVMEHECFEDEEVATLMNKFFVCIKVDREERPDVDQVYMMAVQLMTQRGGWPLNCFTLPDGRPIYGGTYFPKEQWMHVLRSLNHTYANDLGKVLEYAEKLTQGVQQAEVIQKASVNEKIDTTILPELIRRWQGRMDNHEGGPTHAPKFPLPSNYLFLLHYAVTREHDAIRQHTELTLRKMALGGIYDQIGGGFSRYSVDMLWKVPHFEKMMYDNGQLLELYAHAYQRNADPEYLRVLQTTLLWLEREMLGAEGGLFAAQDADSEGIEGKYYVWNRGEIESVLGADRAAWYWTLYNPGNKGYWEHDYWIPLRDETWEAYAKRTGISEHDIATANHDLLQHRLKRIKPVTDTKCLTAWNAMTITGLCAAYRATGDDSFQSMALRIGKWIAQYQLNPDHTLWHTRQNERSFISGFLDDYAFVIQAFVQLYQLSADEQWLEKAVALEATTRKLFLDAETGMYYFTGPNADLIARKMEINDNVIPSTNSVMAHNLLDLSLLTEQPELEKQAMQMLANIADGMEQYGSGYSNWALLLLRLEEGVGYLTVPKTDRTLELQQLLSPFALVKYASNEQYLWCVNNTCSAPAKNLTELQQLLR